MQTDCRDCIHVEVCAFIMPDLPACNAFLSKSFVDKINAVGNPNPVSPEDIKKALENVKGE